MECKETGILEHKVIAIDLIDTLWNVKTKLSLIDITGYFRFNRYIVECKGFRQFGRTACQEDLIDTLWNVKI